MGLEITYAASAFKNGLENLELVTCDNLPSVLELFEYLFIGHRNILMKLINSYFRTS